MGVGVLLKVTRLTSVPQKTNKMETVEIKGIQRKEIGKKSSKKLRKEENVPCVIYGGKEIVHFHAPEKGLKKLIFTPQVFLIKLSIDGKEHNAILQDVQFHPVTDRIIHLDFKEISFDSEVIINLPVKLEGDAKGVKDGGRLRLRRRKLKVKGLPDKFPDFLNIDINDMEIGDALKVGELNFDGLTLLDPHRSMVVAVASSRIAKGMEETIFEEEEVAEVDEAVEGDEVTDEAADEATDKKADSGAETEKGSKPEGEKKPE